MMRPDYEKAATKAAETLIKYNISSAPVMPLPILKKIPGVLIMSYEEMSNNIGIKRDEVIYMFGQQNQDSFTSINITDGKPQYLVTYNQRLPFNLIHKSLTRELGHIVLEHDGSRPEEVRNAEAICFAQHFLSPRPLIHMLLASNIRITTEVFGNITGCFDHCINCMRRMPGVKVPAELNRIIRDNFKDYFYNFFNYQRVATLHDGAATVDFGTFMDGYEE